MERVKAWLGGLILKHGFASEEERDAAILRALGSSRVREDVQKHIANATESRMT